MCILLSLLNELNCQLSQFLYLAYTAREGASIQTLVPAGTKLPSSGGPLKGRDCDFVMDKKLKDKTKIEHISHVFYFLEYSSVPHLSLHIPKKETGKIQFNSQHFPSPP